MANNHVIFIHPDGTSPAHYALARFVDKGPDGRLNWDKLDEARVYLGHMEDQLTGTSNGGAVTHATGTKVHAESFGLEEDNQTPTTALSGKQQTIMQEAVASNKVTALINSGFIAEPGTGAFVAKVAPPATSGRSAPRNNLAEITRQAIESGVNFIMGGGELHMLPVGTTGRHVTAAIDTQFSTGDAAIQNRPATNLIDLAKSLGYTVVYTRDELNALLNTPNPPQKVLGVFAAIHTFNDRSEEALAASNTPFYVETAPTVGEMLAVSQKLMEVHPNFKNGSFTVLEEEGTDNFSNINNAPGTLEALRRADGAIGVALEFSEKYKNTLIVTAADSDGGGLQIRDPLAANTNVGTVNANPTNVSGLPAAFANPLDGTTGRGTLPFTSAPDASGNQFNFGVGWVGTPDFAGSIVAKAHGLNADKWNATVDNTDVYRLMYETLFETDLPDRPVPQPERAPAATEKTGNVIFIHPDGHSPSMFGAARFESVGPDGRLNWDKMSDTGVYLGHLTDQLTGSSDGSGVVHANGVKVFQNSYGLNEDGSRVTPFSGKVGSTILEEARDSGKAVAIINSGTMNEPGSGAFAAEVDTRSNNTEIVRQIILESGAQVIMAGGERWMLPTGVAGKFGGSLNQTGARTDGLNLILEAEKRGYRVVYSKDELNTVQAGEKILGVFAWEDTYNARSEEANAARGLGTYGQPGNLNPPTVADMLSGALKSISSDPDGFFVVLEEEGTDNFANSNNARGTIDAALRADAAIGVAMDFIRNQDPNTLLITAADSEAGGLQVYQPTPFSPGYPDTPLTTAPTLPVNPTTGAALQNPLDGQNGRTAPWTAFNAQPSLDGSMGNFGVGWVGTPDFPGSLVSKTYGMNADKLPSTLDNTEIYKQMYQTLFGQLGDPSAINGTEGDDKLYGTDAGDVFIGKGGEDTFFAGEGNNRVYVGVGNSIVYTGAGDDVISTDDGNQQIYAGEGFNRIATGRGNSVIYSGAGSDIISALGGNNTVYAAEGDNLVRTGNGDNLIYAGAGNDYIATGNGKNTIYAAEGNNTIITGSGDDLIYAGAGNDFFNTGAGNDTIYAAEGNNTIYAGIGNDTAYVGSGLNKFFLESGEGSLTIYGFGADDSISRGSTLGASSILSTSISGEDTLITAGDDLLATLKWAKLDTIQVV